MWTLTNYYLTRLKWYLCVGRPQSKRDPPCSVYKTEWACSLALSPSSNCRVSGKTSHAHLWAVAGTFESNWGSGTTVNPGQEMPEFSHLFPTKESEDSEWAEPIWQQGYRAARGSEEVTPKGRRRRLHPEPTLVAQKSTCPWALPVPMAISPALSAGESDPSESPIHPRLVRAPQTDRRPITLHPEQECHNTLGCFFLSFFF